MSSLRILQVTDHLRAGGAERMVAGLVAALADGGLARSVVCTARADQDADELSDLVRRSSDEHVVLGRHRRIDVRIAADLARVGRRHRVDVVHSHPGTLNAYAHLAARALGVPHVSTLHTMPEPRTEVRWVAEQSDAWSGRHCTAVVAPAATVATAVGRRWRLDPERVWIIPNAVFASAPADALEPPLPADGGRPLRTVLTVARLLTAKGLLDLVDAAAEVLPGRPDVRFAIAGDGPAAGELRARIAAAGLEDRVLLLGHRTDVWRLLDDAAAFCLPSHHEGVPLSLLEAMAHGLPCVTTGVGGVPDVVRDGVDAVVVPPRDPATLAAALGRVLDDPTLAARLATQAAATAARDHTAAQAARRYAELYATVADRAAAR